MLYCIRCGGMFPHFKSPKSPLTHLHKVPTPDEPEMEDIKWCDFNDGWAACEPVEEPKFSLQEYIDRVGAPPMMVPAITFEQDIDETVRELL